MSKSFCRLALANGAVDDGAVSGIAIDGGELINTEPIRGVVVRSVVDNELINRWLRVTFGGCVDVAASGLLMASNKNDNRISNQLNAQVHLAEKRMEMHSKASHKNAYDQRMIMIIIAFRIQAIQVNINDAKESVRFQTRLIRWNSPGESSQKRP